ncbi:MAG: hypothetical protein JST12_18515 [Armatimonadetes bacterium]|nr:hypothetical protein [Armatimonadota bacterium]
MKFPECFEKAHYQTSFCGVEASQAWNDLALWEEFLNRTQPKSVVELGTFKGGMAMYLTLQGLIRGFQFVTIDSTNHGVPIQKLQKFGAEVLQMDLFSASGEEQMKELLSRLPKPCALFCDDGNKSEEWKRYVPLLAAGDYAAGHDWGTEFREENLVPPARPYMQSECEAVESMTRFFEVF